MSKSDYKDHKNIPCEKVHPNKSHWQWKKDTGNDWFDWQEEAPANATGTPVAGTGDDSSTVVVKKKKKLQDKLMRRLKIKETIDRAIPDLQYPKDKITERKNQLKEMARKTA